MSGMSQRFTVTKADEEAPIGETGGSYGAVPSPEVNHLAINDTRKHGKAVINVYVLR